MAKIYSIETLIAKVNSAEQKLTQLAQLLTLAETQERFLFNTGQHSPSDISLQINPRLTEMAAIGEAMSGDIDSTLGSPEINWTNQKEVRVSPTKASGGKDFSHFEVDSGFDESPVVAGVIFAKTKTDSVDGIMKQSASTQNIFETGTPAKILISRARDSRHNGLYTMNDASSDEDSVTVTSVIPGDDSNLTNGTEDKTMRIVMKED